MNDLVSFLSIGIAILSFVGGVIGYVVLAPKILHPKNQWFKKSVIASYIGMSGIFIAILALDANLLKQKLSTFDFGGIWNFVWSILIVIIPAGVFLAVMTYFKTLMLSTYNNFIEQWIKKHTAKRK